MRNRKFPLFIGCQLPGFSAFAAAGRPSPVISTTAADLDAGTLLLRGFDFPVSPVVCKDCRESGDPARRHEHFLRRPVPVM